VDRGVEAGYGGEPRGVFPWLLNSSCTPCSSFASCDVNIKKQRYRSHRLRGVCCRKSTVHLLPQVAGKCERLSEPGEGGACGMRVPGRFQHQGGVLGEFKRVIHLRTRTASLNHKMVIDLVGYYVCVSDP
jgi:hypothetical protein